MNRTYQESIDPMVHDMIQKLLDKEGDKSHWLHCSIKQLFGYLKTEVDEVAFALDDCNPEEVMKEVVDVANFCMMIHDKLNLRLNHKEPLPAHPGCCDICDTGGCCKEESEES